MEKLYGLFTALFILSACSKPGADPVQNIDYKLENAPANTEVTLRFEENSKIFGKGPVNQYFGTYILDAKNNMIYVSVTGSTRMGGPENLLRAETEYLTTLSQANRIYTTENKLILLAPGSKKLIFGK